MPDVFLSLGSNIDRERHISEALKELEALFGALTVSSIYESQAEGFEGEPFFNLAVRFSSDLPVCEIALLLRKVEIAHGRTEAASKFESRSLDIDLIFYGDRVTEECGVKVPRQEVTKYAFILEPLAEIAPDFTHPTLGQTLACLWDAFDKHLSRQQRIKKPT